MWWVGGEAWSKDWSNFQAGLYFLAVGTDPIVKLGGIFLERGLIRSSSWVVFFCCPLSLTHTFHCVVGLRYCRQKCQTKEVEPSLLPRWRRRWSCSISRGQDWGWQPPSLCLHEPRFHYTVWGFGAWKDIEIRLHRITLSWPSTCFSGVSVGLLFCEEKKKEKKKKRKKCCVFRNLPYRWQNLFYHVETVC